MAWTSRPSADVTLIRRVAALAAALVGDMRVLARRGGRVRIAAFLSILSYSSGNTIRKIPAILLASTEFFRSLPMLSMFADIVVIGDPLSNSGSRLSLAEQLVEQLFPTQFEMLRNVREDCGKRSDTERIMLRNGQMMLTVFLSRESQMTPRLAGNDISQLV